MEAAEVMFMLTFQPSPGGWPFAVFAKVGVV
jgi:hypothetical protein